MIERYEYGDEAVSVIKADKTTKVPLSRKLTEDPFQGVYDDWIKEPPYDLFALSTYPERSNILGQCIEAMETNISGFGYRLVADKSLTPDENEQYEKLVTEERDKINDFFAFCNPDIPYVQLCRRTRRDIESTGNGYWEILRNGVGEICGLEHLESHTMRITRQDMEYTEYVAQGLAFNEVNKPKTFQKRFRRFVQMRNGRKVFFKEVGDPRMIDALTGKAINADVSDQDVNTNCTAATEVLHFSIYSATTPYGVPRWMGNLLAVLGSRQAEEVNYKYFESNTVPPLALLVAGKLGDKTVERITSFVEDNIKGSKSWGKMLVVEASPSGMQAPGMPQQRPDIHFEHLSDAQQKDGLFAEYDRVNREKVRSSFRLPSLYVGLSEDYTRATAKESKRVAEEQVFGPERDLMDFIINNKILPTLGVKYWKYQSLAPTSDDSESITSMIQAFSSCGMTVRECRDLMSEVLNRQLESVEEEGADWLDMPMAVYLENLRVKGQQGAEAESVEKMFRVVTGVRNRVIEDEAELE